MKQKYEYITVETEFYGNFEIVINNKAKEGWEAVSISMSSMSSGDYLCVCLMRREKK
tara:strand:- start:1033 stop:1203 length:171 start_codon:yes stop_codon:yes gene_type:complete